MSTNLYEVLEIQADATPEQVRKAYKKRALQTHPDRAPAEGKTQAEEKFRQVNNAYEVLIDPQKRESYDRHGVWPPPTEPPPGPPRRTQDNTRNHPFHSNIFAFTDPFVLFNSFFEHPSPFHDPFGPPRTFPNTFFAPPPPPPFPFLQDPFGPFNSGVGVGGGLFHDVFPHDPFMMYPPMMGGGLFQSQGGGNGGRSTSYISSTSSPSPDRQEAAGGQWVSESQSISTINGLMTSVHERVDSLGNRHTTTTHPDGNKTYTVNGVPQAPGQIDAPPPLSRTYRSDPSGLPHRHHHHHHHHRHDRSRGRYDPHSTHRAYDRDYYPPDHRDPRRPST